MAACVGVWGASGEEIIQVVDDVGDVVLVAEDPDQCFSKLVKERRG